MRDNFDTLVEINHRWKARINWRNNINGFDMFAVPAGKGKLEKILKISSIFLTFPQSRLFHFSPDIGKPLERSEMPENPEQDEKPAEPCEAVDTDWEH